MLDLMSLERSPSLQRFRREETCFTVRAEIRYGDDWVLCPRSADRWHCGPVQLLKRDVESAGGESRQGSGPRAKLTALPLALDLDAAIGPGRESIPAGTKYRLDRAQHAGLALGASHGDDWRDSLAIETRSPIGESRRQCGAPRKRRDRLRDHWSARRELLAASARWSCGRISRIATLR